jgi:hypothetical protein
MPEVEALTLHLYDTFKTIDFNFFATMVNLNQLEIECDYPVISNFLSTIQQTNIKAVVLRCNFPQDNRLVIDYLLTGNPDDLESEELKNTWRHVSRRVSKDHGFGIRTLEITVKNQRKQQVVCIAIQSTDKYGQMTLLEAR